MEKNKIIAIDCAFKNCGIIIINKIDSTIEFQSAKIIVNNRDISKSKSLSDIKRSEFLYSELQNEVISLLNDEYIFAYEIPAGSQSARAAKCLGMAAGIIGALSINAKNKNAAVIPISALEVKKQVNSNINATKDDIMNYVSNKYGIKKEIKGNRITYHINGNKFNKTKFEHIADAIVIAELAIIKMKDKK